MKTRWLRRVRGQFEDIQRTTRREWPGTLIKLVDMIEAAVERAARFPGSGRAGRVKGTRELVLTRVPFTVVYVVKDGVLVVVGLFHHAQEWSEEDLG